LDAKNIFVQFRSKQHRAGAGSIEIVLYGAITLAAFLQLVTCGVSNHSHTVVRLQFFETVARYDRYFPVAASEVEHAVVSTAQAFLDQRGLRSNCSKVRSRCAYLFSRLVDLKACRRRLCNAMKDVCFAGISELLEVVFLKIFVFRYVLAANPAFKLQSLVFICD